MSYRIREVYHGGKFADLINLGLIKQLITTEAIEQALREAGVKPVRYRKIKNRCYHFNIGVNTLP